MKLLTAFILFFHITTLNGQDVILLVEDSISQLNENADISNDFLEFSLDLFFRNNTNDSIFVNWRREFGENCPLEWDVYSVDNVLSYFPQIDESQLPIPMSSIDSNFVLRQSFLPRTVAGCCDIKVIFSLDGSPTIPIDTGYYQIEINSSGCITTSIIEEATKKINVYPNPSSNVINIENNSLLESIEIFDLTGKEYFRSTAIDLVQIDISNFPSGVYICKFKSKLGDTSRMKFLKQ